MSETRKRLQRRKNASRISREEQEAKALREFREKTQGDQLERERLARKKKGLAEETAKKALERFRKESEEDIQRERKGDRGKFATFPRFKPAEGTFAIDNVPFTFSNSKMIGYGDMVVQQDTHRYFIQPITEGQRINAREQGITDLIPLIFFRKSNQTQDDNILFEGSDWEKHLIHILSLQGSGVGGGGGMQVPREAIVETRQGDIRIGPDIPLPPSIGVEGIRDLPSAQEAFKEPEAETDPTFFDRFGALLVFVVGGFLGSIILIDILKNLFQIGRAGQTIKKLNELEKKRDEERILEEEQDVEDAKKQAEINEEERELVQEILGVDE